MIVQAIMGGIIGSVVMLLVLYLITLSRIANADMVRALGSLVTKKMENSVKIGLLIYFTGGIIFSFLYFTIFAYFPLQEPVPLLFLGAFGGFAHGWVVSFALIISVTGRHPVERFRNAGFGVALAHLVGHIAFGIALSLSYIFFNPKLAFPSPVTYAIYAVVVLLFGVVMIIASAIYSSWKNRNHSQKQPGEDGRRIHQL